MTVNDEIQALQSVADSEGQRKGQLQAFRLFHDLFGMDSESTIGRDELNSLLSSAFLLGEHISEICEEVGYRSPIATFGAEILEDAGDVASDLQDEAVLSYHSYSSLNYLITRKFSNSRLMADAALEKLPKQPAVVSTTEQFRIALHRATLLLLSERLEDLRKVTSPEYTKELAAKLVGQVPVSELSSGLVLLRALNNFAGFLQENNDELLQMAQEDLARAGHLGRRELFLGELFEWLDLVFKASLSSYAPKFLAQFKNIPTEYLDLLIKGRRPSYYVWPSQTGALESGLLDHDLFALALPPSSGKTFLAELKIVQRIAGTTKLAFYVVPLNALARQAQTDLAYRLRQAPLNMNIRVLTGTYEINDDDLEEAGVQESVIITTPEKLDGLLRNIDAPDIKALFDRAELFVFDECQNIGSGKRGITLEMLIERIRFQKPNASILGSAAFFSNISEFADWLGGGPQSFYSDDWRPTRQQVASWSTQGGFQIDRHWEVTEYPRTGKTDQDVTKIAIDLQRVYRNVLVVATTRDSAEKYAERLAKEVSNLDKPLLSGEETKKLQFLAEAIRNSIHPNARLAEFVTYGVAYHHARLPANVKSQIEDYIADGTLKLIAATTTLAQGVNFPIRCVVLGSIFIAGNPMGALELQNIIGRAGRAGVSTTGQVILLKNNEWVHSNGQFYKFDDYCFSPPKELLAVRSSLPIGSVAAMNRDRFERTEVLDSQILAFLGQSGFQDEDQIETIAQGTYLAKESSANIDPLKAIIQQRLSRMEETPRSLVQSGSPFKLTEFGNVVRKTGLGSTATRWIVRELEDVINADQNGFVTMRHGHDLDETIVKNMMAITLFDPSHLLDSFGIRMQSKDLFGVPISTLEKDIDGFLSAVDGDSDVRKTIRQTFGDSDLEFLWRWINGATYTDLAYLFLKTTSPTQVQTDKAIEDAIHTVERYATLMDWSVYYVNLFLQHLTNEKGLNAAGPELGNLAHYVRWGVNHPISVFVRETLEWGSRDDALALAELDTGEVAYTSNRALFRAALESASDERLIELLGDSTKVQGLRASLGGGINP